jgi:hypothetical protein
MTDSDDSGRFPVTRRQTLGGTAATIAAALGVETSTAQEIIDTTGGSDMALQEAINVAGDLYVGPDSAKSTVAPDTGRLYKAVDTGVEYYGDGSSWTIQPVQTDSVTVDGKRLYIQSTAPSDPETGDLWIDIS